MTVMGCLKNNTAVGMKVFVGSECNAMKESRPGICADPGAPCEAAGQGEPEGADSNIKPRNGAHEAQMQKKPSRSAGPLVRV